MLSDELVYELRGKIRSGIDFGGSLSDEELMGKTEQVVFEWCESNPITVME